MEGMVNPAQNVPNDDSEPMSLEDMAADGCALYRHFDSAGMLLYVGISIAHITRMQQHRRKSPWFARIAQIRIEHFPTRESALAAERHAIETEKPFFNRKGGRPRLGYEVREIYNVRLEPAVARHLIEVGDGNLAAGIMKLGREHQVRSQQR